MASATRSNRALIQGDSDAIPFIQKSTILYRMPLPYKRRDGIAETSKGLLRLNAMHGFVKAGNGVSGAVSE